MRGGQGEVKEIIVDGEKVACKHPLFDSSDVDAAMRFIREIDIAKKIDSPNVIKILDSGRDEEGLYYTMPLYNENLEVFLSKNGDSVYKNLALQQSIMLSILSGVKALHDSKIIHRDLKPNNVLLNNVDDIVVCDFGLSKDLESNSSFTTTTGLTAGTDRYMSPEQRWDFKRVDFRTDIFALGVLFNDLIGRNRVPNVPKQLCRIADKATSLDKEDRFKNIDEFVSAINTGYKILLRYEDEALVSELLNDISKRGELNSIELIEEIEFILKEENYRNGNAGLLLSCLNDKQYQCFEESAEDLCLDMFMHIWDEWTNEWTGHYNQIDEMAIWVRSTWSKINSSKIRAFNLAKLVQLAHDNRRYFAMEVMAGLIAKISDDKDTQSLLLSRVSVATIKGNYKQIARTAPTWVR